MDLNWVIPAWGSKILLKFIPPYLGGIFINLNLTFMFTDSIFVVLDIKEMIKTELEARNISYSYEDVDIFQNISFSIGKGEFIALIGPSGCGKTTLIHILAGLLNVSQGQVLIDGKNSPRLGKVSLMPQDDLLLPWRTVLENGALPLEIKGINKKEAQEQVQSLLDQFGLKGFENVYPYQLSGGMRQRVAFLRCILSGSKIILLDEPFSALDALTRMKMQEWLMAMWQKFSPTIIFITHDVEEALFLAQKIFLLAKLPNTNIREYTVPFSYPRPKSILADQEFVALRQKILAELGEV